MKTGLLLLAIFLIQTVTVVHADRIADFEKACVSAKKKAGLCRCLAANIDRKISNQDIDADQLPLVLRALKNETPGAEENSTAFDHVADLLAGLEPHCEKNSKYLSDK